MKNGDLDAYIEMDGKRVDEYAVSKEGEAFMSCCIPSEEGKNFAICCEDTSDVYSYRAEFYLDGRLMVTKCVQPGVRLNSRGAPLSSSEVLPYTFSPLRLSSDDTHVSSPGDIEKLGTIEMRLCRVTFDLGEDWFDQNPKLDGIGVIHERSKKAGSHCVTFGERTAMENMKLRKVTNLKFIDPKDDPFRTFRFQYRSRDILQAQGIMPCPANPLRAERSADSQANIAGSAKRAREEGNDDVAKVKSESDSDIEDEDAIQAQMDELRAKLNKARSKRIKREPSPIRLITSGDTIDLTSD